MHIYIYIHVLLYVWTEFNGWIIYMHYILCIHVDLHYQSLCKIYEMSTMNVLCFDILISISDITIFKLGQNQGIFDFSLWLFCIQKTLFLDYDDYHDFVIIRDGHYGACFLQNNNTPPIIYCARPGSRLWEVWLSFSNWFH